MIKLVLPKGRIFQRVASLLNDCGLHIHVPDRAYRPTCSDDRLRVKIMKAQNIPTLIELGSHDLGVTGHDWVEETSADVEVLLDLGYDPVQIVAAAPRGLDLAALSAERPLRVATEYETLTRRWLDSRGLRARIIRSFGATEVFPPEDADLIVDNTATGTTLRENGLEIIDVVLRSTTRVIANRAAYADPARRAVIDDVLLLMNAVEQGRTRVLLEMNIPADALPTLIARLPAMKSPTVAQLWGEQGYAVKAAVLRSEVARLLPELRRLGATDILETDIRKVMA
jgi:ATP phosphoribosyltransferase